MCGWIKICKRLLYPPVWLLILFIILSAALLVMVFNNDWDDTIIAYVVYVFSFYTLTATCIYCSGLFPNLYQTARHKIYENEFGKRYLTDAAFKTHISLYRSLGINLLYVAVNLISGLIHKSAWFVILAIYYITLSVMRFLLLRFVRKVGIGKNRLLELRRSRLCAMILILVNVALSGAVMMMIYQGRGFEYGGILIYVVAMYTFYIAVAAIVDMVKYQKYHSPVMSTAKVINLTAALVSVLSLETAMLAQFGESMSLQSERIMIAATGAGVCLIVIAISVYGIHRSNKDIKALINHRENNITCKNE